MGLSPQPTGVQTTTPFGSLLPLKRTDPDVPRLCRKPSARAAERRLSPSQALPFVHSECVRIWFLCSHSLPTPWPRAPIHPVSGRASPGCRQRSHLRFPCWGACPLICPSSCPRGPEVPWRKHHQGPAPR